MADTLINKKLYSSSSSAIALTDAGSWVTTVLSVVMCNTSSSSETFDLYIDPSGSSATGDAGGTNTYIYKTQTLPSNATFEHTDKIILHANDILYAQFSSTGRKDIITSSLKQT